MGVPALTSPGRCPMGLASRMALPEVREIDPAAVPPLRWGMIGTGGIANQFAPALHRRSTQRLVAVAARDMDRAAQFAERHGVARRSSRSTRSAR